MFSHWTADALNDLQATLGRLDGKASVTIYLGPTRYSSVFICRDLPGGELVSICAAGDEGINAQVAEVHAAVRADKWSKAAPSSAVTTEETEAA